MIGPIDHSPLPVQQGRGYQSCQTKLIGDYVTAIDADST